MELSPYTLLPGTGASRSEGRRLFSRTVPGEGAATPRSSERGGANVKAIVWTVILVAFIYATAMMLPVFISEYEFQDTLQDIARYASVNRKNSEQIRQAVFDEAQKQDLPIQAEDIKVEGNAGNVHINVNYSVTVDLKVYQWTFNFHPAASNAPLI